MLNDTVGSYLPRIMKLYNYRYLTKLPRQEQNQVAFHVDQILSLQPERYLPSFRNINCHVRFINGELDEYTTAEDVRRLGEYIRRADFQTIRQAGHFLDLEGRQQQEQVRKAVLGFFCTERGAGDADEPFSRQANLVRGELPAMS